MQPGQQGHGDERTRRARLSVVFSQDAMRRRTRFERTLAHSRRPVLLVLSILLVLSTACVGAAVQYIEAALHPPRRPHSRDAAARAAAFAARHDATVMSTAIVGVDGAVLRAWWFAPRAPAQTSALLLHGFADNREAMLPLAGLLLDHDVRVLLPDLRAHGSSGGGEVTWGILEAADLAMWAEWIGHRHADHCVSAFGSSLGGGIVLQALARVPLCSAIVEAPFASFVTRASHDLAHWTQLPGPLARVAAAPLVSLSLLYARVRYGRDLRSADSHAALAKSRTPVLLIEDDADATAAGHTTRALAGANPRMTTWRASGAPHAGAWGTHPREFPERVLDFLDRHQ